MSLDTESSCFIFFICHVLDDWQPHQHMVLLLDYIDTNAVRLILAFVYCLYVQSIAPVPEVWLCTRVAKKQKDQM